MNKRFILKILSIIVLVGFVASMASCASKRNAGGFKCPPMGQQ